MINLFFRFFSIFFLVFSVFLLTGCSLSGKLDGGVYKSEDGGSVFNQKAVIDEKTTISRDDVLDIEIDTDQENVVYIGTGRAGLLRTTNGGESWVRDASNFTNVMSVKKIPGSQTIYIAAKMGDRGKVFKTIDGGNNWSEIYTEKSEGSVVGAIAFDYRNPQILYIGNSNGGIFKTEDGGATWRTLLWAESGVRTIVVDQADSSILYFGTMQSGVLITKNAGKDFSEIKKGQVFNIIVHPNRGGTVYLSDQNGLSKSSDYGENWEVLNTLVRPEEISSRGLAINSSRSNEIFYTAGKAFYKSTDEGLTWKPVQFNISRIIREIEIDPHNSNIIYVGTTAGGSSFKLFPN